jgi:ABC-2 type transport system ATP-binding protein
MFSDAAAGSADFALDLSGVSKVYSGTWGRRKVHALRGIDMRIQRGGIFGLLGPNGAGKSTLVKIMMTVIRPTTCAGTMLGRPVGDKTTLRKVGYLPEHHKFPEYLTAAQVLDYFGALSDVPRRERRKRSPQLLGLVGIDKWADHKVKGFSKGMRQRLGIANALMNDPDLIVLDEPTDGVDPVGRRDIRNVLITLRDQGRTILLNSHLLSELEMVCDRVAILVQGKVSALGTIDELTRESRRYEIEVLPPAALAGRAPVAYLPAALESIARLEMLPPATQPAGAPPVPALRGTLGTGVPVFVDQAGLRVGTDDPEVVQPLLDALRRAGVTIKSVRPVRESLEDLFMKAVTDPTTGAVLKPGASDGKD